MRIIRFPRIVNINSASLIPSGPSRTMWYTCIAARRVHSNTPTDVDNTSNATSVSDGTQEFLEMINQPASSSSQTSIIKKLLGHSKDLDKVDKLSTKSDNMDDVDELPIVEGGIEWIQSTDLAEVALWSYPFVLCYKFVELIHNSGGFSWGTSILLSAAVIRTLTSPLHFIAERGLTARFSTDTKTQELWQAYENAKQSGDKLAIKQAFLAHRLHLADRGAPTYRSYLTNGFLLLLPVISHVIAVDRLVSHNIGNIVDEQFLWIKHLDLPDPLSILPTMTALMLATYIALSFTREIKDETILDKVALVAIWMVVLPFAYLIHQGILSSLPAATNLSLSFHVAFSLAAMLSFRLRPVRRLFKLPDFVPVSSLDLLRKSNKREFYAKKAKESRECLQNTISDFDLVFKDPAALSQKYLAGKAGESSRAAKVEKSELKAKSGK